ncbi:phosphoribosylanthranilate isomerase [Rhizobium leguminosarum]|uniref:phosphoribosylanthranilate isomerase n=1 Tax=Rhizobium leguminosarum TaxID=384 RepID=UPI0021BBFC90|nr:hypothetical protein [Rhizobium leguminosarum]
MASTRRSRISTVLLTKIRDHAEIVRMVGAIKPTYIQLHAPWLPGDLDALRRALAEGYGGDIGIIGTVDPSDASAINVIDQLAELSDYLLIDHYRGGTGKGHSSDQLAKVFERRIGAPIFLAAGLNPKNVAGVVERFRPYAVDVQSGVEASGSKDKSPVLVREFVSSAKNRKTTFIRPPIDYPLVVMSLTDASTETLAQLVSQTAGAVDLFHIDYSDGSIVPRFGFSSEAVAEQVSAHAPYTPYDLHVFSRRPDGGETLKRHMKSNSLLRTAYLHCDSSDGFDVFREEVPIWAAECRQLGIEPGLALQANADCLARWKDIEAIISSLQISEISVVGPGPEKTVADYARRVAPVLRLLRDLDNGSERFAVGIDRLITVEKVLSVKCLRPTRVISGAAIHGSGNPLDAIERFRSAIAY